MSAIAASISGVEEDTEFGRLHSASNQHKLDPVILLLTNHQCMPSYSTLCLTLKKIPTGG
jgi:hypothetical protein